MEKASSAFMNNLRYVCLIFVVTFGLITIIGSGGGGSGGDDYVHYCNPSQIYFTYPEDNETDAVGYRLIFVRFTELMDDSTINQSTFTLEDNTGNLVGGSVRFSEYLRCGILGCYPFAHAFFYPSSNLLPSTRYTATLDSTVQDEEGNALGCNYSWSFTTKPDGVGIWQAVSTMNAPSKRYGHTAIWTGTEMIVWGGYIRPDTYLDTGGRYDPSSNSWEETSTIGAPEGRDKHTAVWTGTEMIVWGGYIYPDTYLDTGGRYDPSSNSWEETSTIGAPEGRDGHTAVWTGTEMIVWGGRDSDSGSYLNTGSKYNPVTDTWQAISTMNAPSERYKHTAIWTGTEMIVWGGFYGGYLNTGGRYNPITDTWQAISTTNAPGSRFRHTAIWTGTEMVVWGGYIGPSTYLDTGGRYDPSSNSWEETSTIGAPEGRDKHTAVWTGTEMIVWGGYIYPDTYLDTGGRYDPSSNSWEETSTIGAPEGRDKHTAVWTGTEMIVWGGYTVLERFGESYIVYSIHTGGVYYPDTNIWQETSTTNTPLGMSEHAAVWTGGEMIVWSGTGGRYIP